MYLFSRSLLLSNPKEIHGKYTSWTAQKHMMCMRDVCTVSAQLGSWRDTHKVKRLHTAQIKQWGISKWSQLRILSRELLQKQTPKWKTGTNDKAIVRVSRVTCMWTFTEKAFNSFQSVSCTQVQMARLEPESYTQNKQNRPPLPPSPWQWESPPRLSLLPWLPPPLPLPRSLLLPPLPPPPSITTVNAVWAGGDTDGDTTV